MLQCHAPVVLMLFVSCAYDETLWCVYMAGQGMSGSVHSTGVGRCVVVAFFLEASHVAGGCISPINNTACIFDASFL